jgi:hypothetical protein
MDETNESTDRYPFESSALKSQSNLLVDPEDQARSQFSFKKPVFNKPFFNLPPPNGRVHATKNASTGHKLLSKSSDLSASYADPPKFNIEGSELFLNLPAKDDSQHRTLSGSLDGDSTSTPSHPSNSRSKGLYADMNSSSSFDKDTSYSAAIPTPVKLEFDYTEQIPLLSTPLSSTNQTLYNSSGLNPIQERRLRRQQQKLNGSTSSYAPPTPLSSGPKTKPPSRSSSLKMNVSYDPSSSPSSKNGYMHPDDISPRNPTGTPAFVSPAAPLPLPNAPFTTQETLFSRSRSGTAIDHGSRAPTANAPEGKGLHAMLYEAMQSADSWNKESEAMVRFIASLAYVTLFTRPESLAD